MGQNSFQISISYPGLGIFSGTINTDLEHPSVLEVLQELSRQKGISVQTKNTSLGVYIESIAGLKASGSSGWQYAINGQVPSASAAAYRLNPGDKVQWFYGPPSINPY